MTKKKIIINKRLKNTQIQEQGKEYMVTSHLYTFKKLDRNDI